VEQVVKQEVSLSVKLLAFLNSAIFGWHSQVASFKHALVLLGVCQLKRWANLMVLGAVCGDRPAELQAASLFRAKFCELIGARTALAHREFDLFLTGLFSTLDAILNCPLPEVLIQFSVSQEIQDALLGCPTGLGAVYALVRAYEAGDWENVPARARAVGITESAIPELYRQALEWTHIAGHVVSAHQAE
jgi:EAL and modified HD-GYP domain-containing signal transduction protein